MSFLTPNTGFGQGSKPNLIDAKASRQSRNLYQNLHQMATQYTLVGHQDALAYGVEWKSWHKSRSDIKDVSGSHPAIVGWELSKLGSSADNIDSVNFEQMKGWIKEVYKMRGINTLSWHMDNFVNQKTSWDVGDKVVQSILPGGEHHAAYLKKLDAFVSFVRDLRTGFIFKKDIPLIFRPFHEHTGSWFWWGADHCSPEEYKALWRFTVTYLRDTKGLHNLIWCYSPDIFEDETHYLERYPGDEYVDILGLDDYHDVGAKGEKEMLTKRLTMLVNMAKVRSKLAVLSETGYETIPEEKWWTETILSAIQQTPEASQIAWVMFWRNARASHHYGPYPNHPSSPDFLKFVQDPTIKLAGDFPNPYKAH